MTSVLLNIIIGVLVLPFIGFLVEHFMFGRNIANIKKGDQYFLEHFLRMDAKQADKVSNVTKYFLVSWGMIYLLTYVFVAKLNMNIWLFASIITVIFFIVECFIVPNAEYKHPVPRRECVAKWNIRIPGCKCHTGVVTMLSAFFTIVGGNYLADCVGLF